VASIILVVIGTNADPTADPNADPNAVTVVVAYTNTIGAYLLRKLYM